MLITALLLILATVGGVAALYAPEYKSKVETNDKNVEELRRLGYKV